MQNSGCNEFATCIACIIYLPGLRDSTGWICLGGSFAEALTPGISDHSPILVRVMESPKYKKAFRFFNLWVDHPSFKQIVQEGWRTEVQGSAMFRVVQKLKSVKNGLKLLNRR